jgi:hypothetical protein
MRNRQLNLFSPQSTTHGGVASQGKRKTARPFDRRQAIHLTLRATSATREWSMLARKHKGWVYLHGDRIARESNVKLYRFVNVGNHLHIVVKARSRGDFQRFLRILTGKIAMLVTGARKGRPLAKRFWDLLAHTKLIQWGRQFENLAKYMEKNLGEAEGPRAVLISDNIEIRASS